MQPPPARTIAVPQPLEASSICIMPESIMQIPPGGAECAIRALTTRASGHLASLWALYPVIQVGMVHGSETRTLLLLQFAIH